LIFNTIEEYQQHLKSELYRFNLKRKTAGLPPITPQQWSQIQQDKRETELSEQLEEKGTHHLKKKNIEKNEKRKKRNKQRQLHQEQKAKDNEGKTVDQLIDELIQDKKGLDVNHSLFCNNVSENLERNILFMRKNYTFIIPEVDYCNDIEGLIRYLGEKIGIGHYSIWDHKQFGSVEACQSHMRDTQTCKMLWEGNEEEYAQFYDMEGLKQKELAMSEVELHSNGFELVVNNEKIIGHRDLAIYYKQGVRYREEGQALVSATQRVESIEKQKKKNVEFKTQQRIYKERLRINLQCNNQRFYRPDNPI